MAVLGASGYAGALAAALLHRHPRFELTAITSRSDVGRRLDALYPRHRVPLTMEDLDLDRHAEGLDAAVVAYPHHAAASTVAGLRERGVRVIDLSADFRLRTLSTYEQWYGAHPAPDLLDAAVYGIPELGYRDAIKTADIVANPGCFPTAALLGLAATRPRRAAPRRRDRREDRRLRRRPRRDGRRRTSSRSPRTSAPTRSTATATRRRSTRSWPCSARSSAPSPSSRTSSRSTRAS